MKASRGGEGQGGGGRAVVWTKSLYYRKASITMNKIYNFETKKENWTIKTKIDIRPKTICKTILVIAMAVVLISGVIKWLN